MYLKLNEFNGMLTVCKRYVNRDWFFLLLFSTLNNLNLLLFNNDNESQLFFHNLSYTFMFLQQQYLNFQINAKTKFYFTSFLFLIAA